MRGYVFGPPPRKPLRQIVKNPVYKLFARQPMPKDLLIKQAIDMRLSFENAVAGKVTWGDIETLEGLVNTVMVLAENHLAESDLEAALEAQKAMLRAHARAIDGKTWNFDGPGRQAMLTVMDYFEQLAAQVGQGEMADALLEVMDRKAQGLVHRMERVV